MIYDLVLNNDVFKTKAFADTPPLLAQNKGKWLERVEVKATESPTVTENIVVVHTVTDTESIHTETIVDRFEDIPGGKTKAEQEAEAIAAARTAAQDTLKAACENAIAAIIQAEVDVYNDANGLTLTDVKSCALYAQVAGYSHQAFCQAVWAWNVEVWEAARSLLSQAFAGEITIISPTDVIGMLPVFVYPV